jgi:hypothetical protein
VATYRKLATESDFSLRQSRDYAMRATAARITLPFCVDIALGNDLIATTALGGREAHIAAIDQGLR